MTAQMKTNASAKKLSIHLSIFSILLLSVLAFLVLQRFVSTKLAIPTIKLLKKQDVGGTWRENTYPGCGCDVPSALYSYSFAQVQNGAIYLRQPKS
jgi:hypothetical protein